jgi:Metallopeptidase family M81
MTQRIAIGGFLHESHSFAPRPTTYADFVRPAGFPPLTEGAAVLDAVRGTSVPAAGALAVADAAGVDVIPLAWGLSRSPWRRGGRELSRRRRRTAASRPRHRRRHANHHQPRSARPT